MSAIGKEIAELTARAVRAEFRLEAAMKALAPFGKIGGDSIDYADVGDDETVFMLIMGGEELGSIPFAAVREAGSAYRSLHNTADHSAPDRASMPDMVSSTEEINPSVSQGAMSGDGSPHVPPEGSS